MAGEHVRVRVGAESYALSIESVTEVAELHDLTPVPGAGAAVLGVLNLHGQVLPVFDLARVLGVQRDGGAAPRVVVTEENGRRACLAVDEVTDVGPLPPEREEAELEYLSSAVLDEGRLVGVLDVRRVFEALGQDTR